MACAQQVPFPRPPGHLPSSPTPRGTAAAALPAFSKSPPCPYLRPPAPGANKPAAPFPGPRRRPGWLLVALAWLCLIGAASSPAAVHEVGAIGLTVADLDRELAFFTRVLPFTKVSEAKSAPGAADELLGLSGTELRSVELKLGEERITLTEHLTTKGRPIPPDSRSFDLWFQHLAIVVSDMDLAYAQLRRARVRHVSTAPQTLPAWNQDAGGIKAFYFRDPEDHVLELIWFPPGKGLPKWQRAAAQPNAPLFLGLDHTAIVVSDTERSLAFYRDTLGLNVAGGAENYGVEQEHLNQVFGARLRITALRAPRGPGIELLEYIAPPGGRALPPDAKANDLVFWHPRLSVPELDALAAQLRGQAAPFVSRRPGAVSIPGPEDARSLLVRDPDGHALQLIEPGQTPGREALTRGRGTEGAARAITR